MAGDGLFETTSIPGHLAPTAERLERLLASQSIEELYEVEEQPFARGKYATVRRCRERSSGRQWAAKFLRKRRRAQELRAEALHEVAVLDAAAHCPHLVSLHQVFETSTEMVLVLELAPGGELQMVLDRDEIPEEREVAKLLRQILDGVAFLHSLNVAHLDIKPQNLVLTGEFPDCDVKLCDFGISRYISHGADIREILGTPDYIAPEVLNYEPISLATDMWSVGVLLYVLLTGCSPFGGDTKQETFCNISRCKLDFPDDLFEEVSEEAQDLIRRLIVKNPSERLSATECLQHPWLAKFEEEPTALSLFVSESSEIVEVTAKEEEKEVEVIAVEEIACDNSAPIEQQQPRELELVEESTVDEMLLVLEDQEPPAAEVATELVEGESCTSGEVEGELPEVKIGDEEDEDETLNPSEPTVSDETTIVEADGSVNITVNIEPVSTPRNKNTSLPAGSSDSEYVYLRKLSSTVPRASRNSNSHHHQFNGLSSERRSNFKRSMDYLARKFSASADLLEALDDSVLEMENSSRRSSVNTTSSMGEVFKCTPVFILGEEQQCSDSGSDTVSEISTDSSSDRSSIYSDDSLDFILYGKTPQGGRVSFPFSTNESNSWKTRHGANSSASSIASSQGSLRHGPRVWPRECNGVVSKALSRFTTGENNVVHHHHHYSTLGAGTVCKATTSSGMSVSASSSTSSSTSSLTSSSTTRTSTTRSITGLEALRSRGENLVVIREPVRAGRYMRYSEVQCESVQARIRRFQVHGSS